MRCAYIKKLLKSHINYCTVDCNYCISFCMANSEIVIKDKIFDLSSRFL